MNSDIEINIRSVIVNVKPVESENTLAIVELKYLNDQAAEMFIIRGITIKWKHSSKSGKRWLSVDFPAYSGKNGQYYKSFIIPQKESWLVIAKMALRGFHEQTGGKYTDLETGNEHVNPEEVPV